ncbi:TonB-dependent receptor [Sulfurimonas sp. HSL3-2]|uniref:TonB-dependent receptor n=1 Tax=Hydrocurvibacter mobilis TaxID=3131936 RepID=UPI0031F9B02D
MKKTNGIVLSAICAFSLNLSASDLGMIQVESSTIVDKFISNKTEVSSTATISGETVDDAHTENIQQILQSIPGVTTTYTDGDSLKIHLRGVENQMYMGEKPGVAVVIDGVPVFERTGSVNIDLDNIESIKVIKGGASYLFGDDALSGAVIITTKKGAHYNNNFGTFEMGSYGYKKVLARTGYADENLNFHVQASERKSDGYYEDSGYDAKYLNGKLQYYIDDTSDLTFGLEVSDRAKDSHGTVGGETEAKNNPESIYDGHQESRDYVRDYKVKLLKLFLTYSKDFENNSNLLVNGYIYTDKTKFISSPQTRDATGAKDSTLDDKDYVYNNDYAQIQRGIKSEYRTSSENFATLLGLDLRANEYKNNTSYRVNQALITSYFPFSAIPDFYKAGETKSNDKTDENVYAIYGEYKQGLTQNLSMTANIRYDLIKLKYEDYKDQRFDNSFEVYSYRLGSNYQLDETSTIFANYSTGFRAPTVSQLYAGDLSAWGSTQNNPDLKPEESRNYELGFRTKKHQINYELSVYELDRKDFIMKSSGNYGTTDTTDMWANIGGARHRGLELAANGPVAKELSFTLAYTYLDAVYTDYKNFGIDLGGPSVTVFDVTGNRIPRTSQHEVNFITYYYPLKGLKLTGEVNAKSDYYADDLNKLKIKGQRSVNLGVEYKKKTSDGEVAVFARVDNVLDNQYYNVARASSDRNSDGVFDYEDLSITVNPGRVFTAGFSLKF